MTHQPAHDVQPQPSAPQRPDGIPRWRTVNITARERTGRIIIGLGAVLAGIILLSGAGSALMVVLTLLLTAVGLDLVVTGALGHCPLYQRLGHVPPSLRRPS
ncbi:MAG: DUF2892 domain-containing protein [Streptosporangiaceae bacterium]